MAYFHDTWTGKYYPVEETPIVDPNVSLNINIYYRIDDLLYPYLGEATSRQGCAVFESGEFPGGFYKYNGKFRVIPWKTDEEKERYSIVHICPHDPTAHIYDETITPEQAVEEYVAAYNANRNTSSKVKVRENFNGSVYIPVFRENDNGVERVLKRMIVAMGVRSSEYRKKVADDYMYDNLVSSLDCATRHTSILKILDWFKLLNVNWEFSVFSKDLNYEYALKEPLVVKSGLPYPSADFVAADFPKEIFVVDLSDADDPFKRLIKLALYKTQIPKAVYRKKGSTTHQINNLMSALKNKQKMASDYFEMWCELLLLDWICRVEDPVSGIWYQANGYEITTNNPNDEELKKYE